LKELLGLARRFPKQSRTIMKKQMKNKNTKMASVGTKHQDLTKNRLSKYTQM
jgi:hypothetical protein